MACLVMDEIKILVETREHLREEPRHYWRATPQPAEKYGYLMLRDLEELEECAAVDTRWEAIAALSFYAEKRASRAADARMTGATVSESRRQVYSQNRRARALGLESGLTTHAWECVVADFENRCAYCGSQRRHSITRCRLTT